MINQFQQTSVYSCKKIIERDVDHSAENDFYFVANLDMFGGNLG